MRLGLKWRWPNSLFAYVAASEWKMCKHLKLHLTPSNRCTQSSFFEREGMDEARNLRCPVSECNFVWCKDCQQEIVPDGPDHSCDGTSEMNHLVQQQGWKYCPCK